MATLQGRLVIIGNDTTAPTHTFESDFVPPSSEGWTIIASGTVLILLTTLWTFMRFWSLKRSGRQVAMEDGLNLGALVTFYGFIASNFVLVLAGGMGHHLNELQPRHVVRLSKGTYAAQFLYAVSLGLVKISVIQMFKRIFFVRRFVIFANCLMAFSILWMLLTILMGLLVCRPVEMNWDPQTPGGWYGDQVVAFSSIGIVDLATELTILFLPVPMLWRLKMQMRYKIVVACMFAGGLLTMSFGAARLYSVLQVDFTDTAWSAVSVTIYGPVEAGVAIIVSSSPLLKPVYDKVLGNFVPRLTGSSNWEKKNAGLSFVTIGGAGSRKSNTKSSGFTKMWESKEDLELGNMGAHRSKQATEVTVGQRQSSDRSLHDSRDDNSVRGIVVTNETIIRRDKGEL
ncbi:hypothetical protein F4778DRAFT_736210 [Xylariomycetidae sp. FL2044]|nr:hypothetical protein F4778DRAFT_736210 [Xylariomycetidae sp. FL2044]